MKIYRYWVKYTGKLDLEQESQKTILYGKSNISMEDAVKDAEHTEKLIQERIRNRKQYISPPDYSVPIREQMLEEVAPGNIVTRNYYGAEILNTETLIIADIDYKCYKKRYVPGFFGRLFGKTEESEAQYQDRIWNAVLNSIQSEWIKKSHIRIYKTHSGYRVLFAGLHIDAGSLECSGILRAMNSDPLYVQLCEKQVCCRARLTPKPFRIKQTAFRKKYPYEPEDTDQINAWIQEYRTKSEQFAVCKLIKTLGLEPNAEDVRLIEYHDEKCKAAERLPLA